MVTEEVILYIESDVEAEEGTSKSIVVAFFMLDGIC